MSCELYDICYVASRQKYTIIASGSASAQEDTMRLVEFRWTTNGILLFVSYVPDSMVRNIRDSVACRHGLRYNEIQVYFQEGG